MCKYYQDIVLSMYVIARKFWLVLVDIGISVV